MSNLALKIGTLQGWRRLLLTLGAGALAAVALPPLAAWPVLFAALPVIVWLLDGLHAQSDKLSARLVPAFAIGWAFGFGYFGVSLYWIGEAFLVDAELFAWLMPFAVTALPAGLALFWGLAAMLAIAFWSVGAYRVFVFAASLAAFEWLRGHVLTGFPWNAPAYATDAILPLAQSASLIGLYGLCFLVLAWAAAPAMLTDRGLDPSEKRIRSICLAVLLASVLAAFIYGSWRLQYTTITGHSEVQVRVIQANIAQKDKWRPENRKWIYQRYLNLTRGRAKAASPAVIVWPESALPILLDEHEGTRRQIAKAASGAQVILGSLRRDSNVSGQPAGTLFNSVLALDRNGEVAARYDKQKLVPFGEYLPLARLFEPLGLRKLVTMPAGFASGPGPQTVHLAGVPSFAPLICYEAIFPHALLDRTDRPHWLLNVTNDAWFGSSGGPYQHLAQARMRAIEEGLPLVRAANTGISAVVDPLGRITHRLPVGSQGVIDATLPASLPATPYAKYGDWPILCIIGLVFLGRIRTFFRI